LGNELPIFVASSLLEIFRKFLRYSLIALADNTARSFPNSGLKDNFEGAQGGLMTPFSKLDVLTAMKNGGLIPVFNHPNLVTCQQIVVAVEAAGCQLGEFTIRGEFPLVTFGELSMWVRKTYPKFMLGAGSVQDGETAVSLIHNSATFIVGPLNNLSIIKACNRYGVLGIPGCMTPTEFQTAMEAGCNPTKYFPGGIGGPQFLSALRGPCPQVDVIPTGKTNPDNATEWIKAGAFALGMGTELFSTTLDGKKVNLIATGDYAAITLRIKEVLETIRAARGDK